MMTYDYTMTFTPGSKLVLADMLSRGCHRSQECVDELFEGENTLALVEALPISAGREKRIRQLTHQEKIGECISEYSKKGWPAKGKLPPEVKKFFGVRDGID